MTTTLREAFLKEASKIIDNDELLEEAVRLLRNLRRDNDATLKPYTREELFQRIEQSLSDDDAGKVYTHESVKQAMQQQYPFLCK
ncbi:MAG TPA: hypothetical protein DDZ96_01775 [Porphyromonadaceae bacterium]|jgi:hypothetical protein|uniref:hypothetical protein n=1 Tax=Limibacterium fermenti TaxID=3229863 RepID=UPI000E9A68B0|nr:hypothetical protein [Porphyromonadaceae bacterium]HBK32516.1 hypothetical protein [Porphyromonadaceae bacterium]HBL32535.1 hypothetical protein [Porphyromonadaceae bacterium]HBX21034.1 hypothetical protein [Porphyromonadaceae bacterium]HBX45394.1 hypothetical protein [Porphyromonadaceae bacterium]